MDSHCLNLRRVLHMLQDEDGNDVDKHGVDTPYLLVALHTDMVTQHLLSLPILSSRWSWTRSMIYGLQAYAKWQESEVSVVKTLSLHTCRFGCVTVRVFHVCSAKCNGKSSCHQISPGRSASWQRRPSVRG